MVVADIPQTLLPYAEPALARLRYLYPRLTFALCESGIKVNGDTSVVSIAAREVLYAVYREKIYAETLPLRRSLIDAVTRP
jgi:hypothetical protein